MNLQSSLHGSWLRVVLATLVSCWISIGGAPIARADKTADLAKASCGADGTAASRAPDLVDAVLGTLTGRFIFDGTPPEPKDLKISLSRDYLVRDGTRIVQVESPVVPEFKRAADFGVPNETLLVDKQSHGIANVVIWLRSKNVPLPESREAQPSATLRAKDFRLQPHVMTVSTAGSLRFANDTDSAVNFNFQPLGGGGANPLVRPGEHVDVEIKRGAAAPLPGRVTSNLQPWFAAYVLPLEHPYAAVSGATGRFQIRNLPPGEWEFRIWHERTGWLKTEQYPQGRFTQTIRAGENALGEIHVAGQTLLNSERIVSANEARARP